MPAFRGLEDGAAALHRQASIHHGIRDRRPRIGITALQNVHSLESRATRGLAPELTLDLQYARALEATGLAPVLLAPIGLACEVVLGELDGVCLPGGPDLDPATYNSLPHPNTGPTCIEVDRFEIELVHEARERKVPILGICRGAQVINVAFGGTLTQHLA